MFAHTFLIIDSDHSLEPDHRLVLISFSEEAKFMIKSISINTLCIFWVERQRRGFFKGACAGMLGIQPASNQILEVIHADISSILREKSLPRTSLVAGLGTWRNYGSMFVT